MDFVGFRWISGFQIGFLPTVYEISFVADPSAMADSYRWVTVLRRSDTLNKRPKMRSTVDLYRLKTRSLRFSEDGIGVQPT